MINRFIFSQTNLDSAYLTVLASVVHRFPESGLYFGKIKRGESEVGQFKISVDQSYSNHESIKINLKDLELPTSQQGLTEKCSCFALPSNGYAVFFVSTGQGGYVLEINKIENGTGKKVFDNRELQNGDMFAATLLRPGTYHVINLTNKTEAKLNVTYPEIGKTPRNAQSIIVECTEKSITPAKINVNPGQGLVFSVKVPSRIRIELVEPEDRPKQNTTEKQTNQVEMQSQEESPPKKLLRRLRLNPT